MAIAITILDCDLLLYGRGHRTLDRFRLDDVTDEYLLSTYGFPRPFIDYLVELLGGSLSRPTQRSRAISPETQIMAALGFYTSGSFQTRMGDTIGISQASMSRCVTNVTEALVERASQFISFPHEEASVQKLKDDFYNLAGVPGVLGVVDCMHVTIKAPNAEDLSYVNRRGLHSLNCLLVCDAQGVLLWADTQRPGSTQDNVVLHQSELSCLFETKMHKEGWMLGKSNSEDLGEPNILLYGSDKKRTKHLIPLSTHLLRMTQSVLLGIKAKEEELGALAGGPQRIEAAPYQPLSKAVCMHPEQCQGYKGLILSQSIQVNNVYNLNTPLIKVFFIYLFTVMFFIFFLTADSAFLLRPWLMTPVQIPESPQEYRYNMAHTATHSVMERTQRALRHRFRCLDGSRATLQYSSEKSSQIVLACCILHNIALQHGLDIWCEAGCTALEAEEDCNIMETVETEAYRMRQELLCISPLGRFTPLFVL
ncbi:hypothetical protein AB205_0219070, partial [Aquarana catesbeiana]